MGDIFRRAATGALAGGLATIAMSAVLLAGQRAGLFKAYPPEIAVKESTDPEGPLPTLRDEEQEKVWPLAHFELGGSFGLAYGLIRPGLPRPLQTGLGGALLGIGLWLFNYAVVAPGLGLLPPPPRDDTGRQMTNLAAHAVFGATLAAILERTER